MTGLPSASPVGDYFRRIACTDVEEFSSAVAEWNGGFSQLSAGQFAASGGITRIGAAIVARITINQTVLHGSHAPDSTVAFLFPGSGSGSAFLRGREIVENHCVSITGDACCETITNGHFVIMAAAIDLNAWSRQSHWLDVEPVVGLRGTRLVPMGEQLGELEGAIGWTLDAIDTHPDGFSRDDVRDSLGDRLFHRLSNMGPSAGAAIPDSRSARIHRRIVVERARDYIHRNLSEQIRLSELCTYARAQSRCLEYGFREITGLSPFSYVKALRLGNVRRALLSPELLLRSISEIACDSGFWHLSQFAVDYRKFFGESPSVTRSRTRAAQARPSSGKAVATACQLQTSGSLNATLSPPRQPIAHTESRDDSCRC